MIKEIKYNNYSANPSDYECSDGDLALTMGLVHEDGAMHPILPPSLVQQFESRATVKYIHETANFKHYIILKSSKLYWCDTSSSAPTVELRYFDTTIHEITSLGNTLIVLAGDGMHYFLWKGEESNYSYLGTEIPECPLSFGLQGEMVRGDEFEITFNPLLSHELWLEEFDDANKTIITDQVLGKVNKFIADSSTKGKFIYPFLLRYAYRLYDGTLTKHSAPILMVCSSDLAPQVFYTHITGGAGEVYFTKAKLQIVSVLQTLDYAVDSQSALKNLQDWKDLIRSVDIFISKPIYTYDQNGKCTRFVKVSESDSYCICKHTNQAVSTTEYPLRYQYNKFSKLYAFTFNPGTLEHPTGRLMLPTRSSTDVKNDIKNCSQFYFLDSIKIEHLAIERTPIKVEENYLQSLVTREVMTDDYDSHDRLIPQYSFPYNSRLNIANVKKVLFKGYDAASSFPHSDGYVALYSNAEPTAGDKKEFVTVYVHIKQDGREIIVKSPSGSFGKNSPILFFFYPNINAYKAVIGRGEGEGFYTYYEIPLEQHSFLNGSFYFKGWEDLDKETTYPGFSTESARTIELPNKLYTSEVNNPFHFPVLGVNTLGTGNILGISAAAKALSEGQFGEFPLYAFTTEGVWALEVSNTGTYSAKQPITRDVVINPDSITQIDSAVLFATDRGIMHISGSTVQCISDRLNTEEMFSISSLPKCDNLINIFNSKAHASEQITLDDISLLPFSEFLSGCRMVYDYTHQHLIVYNPSVRYAYVYSFKSHTWGMMRSDIVDNVNSYPEALAMSDGAKLVDFSNPVAENITALLITRPFKLDDPNTFNTINTIIQRGMFRSTHVQQVLYGSNDLIHWHAIWSSVDNIMRGFRGTPYKAFRLALICKFDKGESLYGCTVAYEPRMTNQIR